MAVDPISAAGAISAADLVPAVTPEGGEATAATGADGEGGGFGRMLADKVAQLDETLTKAELGSQQLATGQAEDVTSVIMQVEKASLELQLASQFRNKAVEAYQDLFRMQV